MYSNKEFPSLDTYTNELFNVLNFFKMSTTKNQSSSKKFLSTMFVIFFFILMIMMWFVQICCLNDIESVSSLSEHMAGFNYTFLGIFKWYHCMTKHGDLEKIIEALRKCHNLCRIINKSDQGHQLYREKMLQVKKLSRKFMIIWAIINAAGLTQWCLAAIIYDYLHNAHIDMNNENITYTRKFPAVGRLPFKINTWSKYSSIFFLEFIASSGCSIGFATFDILCASLLMFISAQLSYLNETLISKKDIELITNSPNCSEIFLKKIENCTLHHSRILMVHKTYENYSSRPMFVQCLENALNLCMVSLNVSTMEYSANAEFALSVTSMIELWFGTAFELLLYCYYGTKIEQLSLQVSESFFSSGWEKLSIKNYQLTEKKIQNILRLGIFRAQQPIIITGGPFYDLNLPTFKNLVYLSISNAIVLRQAGGI